MVETRINPTTGTTEQVQSTTPEVITTSMIITDLENGIDRTGIKAKYSLEAWEVKQMFDHPVLKGKKAKRVKKLSFSFVDDTVNTDVLPGQTNLVDQIAEEDAENLEAINDAKTEEEVFYKEEDKHNETLESRADDWANEHKY
tara:strand:- start:4449 stop:4877 length:429 start_codon:yes stop_codon:yes gene_type:complete